MATQLVPIEVFCFYAHEDEGWLRRLEMHLSLLKRQGLISLWHDRLIGPGANWSGEIDARMETAMKRLAQRLEIDTLLPEQGALLLLRRAGLIPPDAPIEQAGQKEREQAIQLSQDLGGLPLALDQAGAYLEETGIDLVSYAQLYQQHRATFLSERGSLIPDHPEPVATTWSLSFENVQKKNPAAAQLLQMAAFLSPDAIPEELFTDGASSLDSTLAPVVTDPLRFNKALEALRAYSLIKRNPTNKTLSLHRLVQAVLQDTMEKEEQRWWVEQVVLAVYAVSPSPEHKTWPQCERLLTQAMIATHWIDECKLVYEEAPRLLYDTAYYLQERARCFESVDQFTGYCTFSERYSLEQCE